jgi:predicted nucleic acid-binding protein
LTGYVLIDTNVLVNAVDPLEALKARIATIVIDHLALGGRAAISTQAVIEYFVSTTRPKLGRPPIFTRPQAATSIAGVLNTLLCLNITPAIALTAVRHAAMRQMRVYDAQMWAVAREYGIPILLTEDAQHAAVIEGVRYVNPFDDAFDLADLAL